MMNTGSSEQLNTLLKYVIDLRKNFELSLPGFICKASVWLVFRREWSMDPGETKIYRQAI
jgi:hypothetical protein